MDNLTHTLFAVGLTRIPGLCRSRLSAPALVIAANLPDLDGLSRPLLGVTGYLAYHRGITHSVLGIVVQVLVITTLVQWLEARLGRGGDQSSASQTGRAGGARAWIRRGPGLAIAVGFASHPMLDLLNVYGLRPWLPFSDRWVYGDLVFVADPWLWLLLGVAAWIPSRRSRVIDAVAAGLFVVTSAVLFWFEAERAPAVLKIVWVPAFMMCLWWRGSGPCRRAWSLGWAGALLYLLLLGWARAQAFELGRPALVVAAAEEVLSDRFISLPEPASPHRWSFVAESDEQVWIVAVDLLSGEVGAVVNHPKGLLDPRVIAALRSPGGCAFAGFARVPIAATNGDEVVLRDARYLHTDFLDVVVPSPK